MLSFPLNCFFFYRKPSLLYLTRFIMQNNKKNDIRYLARQDIISLKLKKDVVKGLLSCCFIMFSYVFLGILK